MTQTSAITIQDRWPAQHPERLQLYSYPTPNGVKISVALEEMGLEYEAHRVTLADSDVKSPAFLSLNPNNKIPAIVDPDGPGGEPLPLFESGAILIYLAEKTGKFIGSTPAQKYETIQWLMFQMGGVGPMFGQLGFFAKFAGSDIEDPRPKQRYLDEGRRLLNVIEKHLDGRDWITGEYSIADMAICPWIGGLDFYGVKEDIGWSDFPKVAAYLDRFLARPAVQRGRNIPPRD